MKIKDLIDAIEILGTADIGIGGEHDMIYLHLAEEETTLSQRNQLEELGFHIDEYGYWSHYT